MKYDGFHKIRTAYMPNGEEREVLQLTNAVAVLLIDNKKRFAMVNQYRAPIGKEVLEIPAGLLDKKGLNAIEVIKEEIMEECGFSEEMTKRIKFEPLIDEVYSMIGSSDTTMTIYIGYYGGVGVDRLISNDDVTEVVWKDLEVNLKTLKDVKHDMKSMVSVLKARELKL